MRQPIAVLGLASIRRKLESVVDIKCHEDAATHSNADEGVDEEWEDKRNTSNVGIYKEVLDGRSVIVVEAILIDINTEKNEEEEEWSIRSVDEAHTIGSCSSERKRRTGLEAAEELTGDVIEDVRVSLVKEESIHRNVDHRDEDERKHCIECIRSIRTIMK